MSLRRSRLAPLLGAALLPLVAACRLITGDDTVCTLSFEPGIVLTVLDSTSRAQVSVGAVIVAREGAYADSIRLPVAPPGAMPAPVGLAGERAGTYEVTVESPGYRPWRRTGVRVTEGRCHVNTVALTALLQRAG
ncbi:PEGA domain-containing protein [Roseisolibacter agri]|uniref:PEGA domain-containing protein n=1 Tax=Roseisolibacter agri TaxID=2014610 RepID=A0AA37V8K6_9BACT|nr:PEGA domain-containing protein [Roseisolibacter agri]GLC23533.1 hypothetical protein rosag_00460 [Roseisolibacter agri]